jgi:hypothetical protein
MSGARRWFVHLQVRCLTQRHIIVVYSRKTSLPSKVLGPRTVTRGRCAVTAPGEMAISTPSTSALDEAIALIDSLCAKLRSGADGQTASSEAGTANGIAAQVAPPVKQPWRALASSRIPGESAAKH